MFILDDILLSPGRGLLMVFTEIHKAVLEELHAESQRLRDGLADLYRELEGKRITEDEFDAREKTILDRLDEIEAQLAGVEIEEEDDDDEDEDEDEVAPEAAPEELA